MKAYKTLLADAADEYVVQKSRFIGRAAPVETEEAALAFLDSVRREHKTASHNCYAYIIGQNAGVMRYNDDGEPGGTAGLPMMEVLRARGVVNCAARWSRAVFRRHPFGCRRADARVQPHLRACAERRRGVRMAPAVRWRVQIAYPQWDRVQHALKSLPVRAEAPAYGAEVEFSLLCRGRTRRRYGRSSAASPTAARRAFRRKNCTPRGKRRGGKGVTRWTCSI
jgi:putative IMPACT (imprinted ancient) family translation regulator